jgi:hypothetical protein
MIMVRNLILLVFAFGCISMTSAQKKEKIKGDRNVTVKETPIDAFNKIVVNDKFKVDIIEGAEAKVFIETDDNLHDIIQFSVTDSVLNFNTTKKITSSKKMSIKVTYSNILKHIETLNDAEISSLTSVNLPEVTLTNSGNSKAFLNIKTEKFKHINSDKARVKLNLEAGIATLELGENTKLEALINADSLQVDMYQRSDAKIEGEVLSLDITADNSSTFTGKNLTANTCNVVSGLNTDIYLQVKEQLAIDASGNTEIYIFDNPKITIHNFKDTAKLYKKETK